MDEIQLKLFLYLVIVLSSVFHEYAHGWEAYRLGDPTAKLAGRLRFNPLVHLDPLGTVFIPLFLLFTSGIFIGWAKPVPYNPYNLTDRRYGSLKVAAAGPLTNLFIAVVLGIVLRVFVGVFDSSIFVSGVFPQLVALIVYINIFLALFNLIPVPPLDGFKIFTDLFPRSGAYLYQVGYFGIFLAIAVAFFVLSPLAQSLFWLITGQNFFF